MEITNPDLIEKALEVFGLENLDLGFSMIVIPLDAVAIHGMHSEES
jgi:hypothetical protein